MIFYCKNQNLNLLQRDTFLARKPKRLLSIKILRRQKKKKRKRKKRSCTCTDKASRINTYIHTYPTDNRGEHIINGNISFPYWLGYHFLRNQNLKFCSDKSVRSTRSSSCRLQVNFCLCSLAQSCIFWVGRRSDDSGLAE